MKIYIELPGGCIELERQPMTPERFRAVVTLAGGGLFALGLVAALYITGPVALLAVIPASIVALCVWG